MHCAAEGRIHMHVHDIYIRYREYNPIGVHIEAELNIQWHVHNIYVIYRSRGNTIMVISSL